MRRGVVSLSTLFLQPGSLFPASISIRHRLQRRPRSARLLIDQMKRFSFALVAALCVLTLTGIPFFGQVSSRGPGSNVHDPELAARIRDLTQRSTAGRTPKRLKNGTVGLN